MSIENDQTNWVQEWGQAINGLGLKPDVDVHGGKRHQAHQEEIANDDEDRAVHEGVARVGSGRVRPPQAQGGRAPPTPAGISGGGAED